jgi:hypothetical protein
VANIKTGIKSRRNIDGRQIGEYTVKIGIVFDYSERRATEFGCVLRSEYREMSADIYHRINFAMPDGSNLLSSVKTDNGRDALAKLRQCLGSETNQLSVLRGEMNQLTMGSQSDFINFENELGGIVKEWNLLCENSKERSIRNERLTKETLKREVLDKISTVFSDVWRDCSKTKNRDGYKEVLNQCRNQAIMAAKQVTPASHANVLSQGRGGFNHQPLRYAMQMQRAPLPIYPPSYSQAYPTQPPSYYHKGGKGSRTCDNCGLPGHVKDFCAQKGGVFEGNLSGAILASRASRLAQKGLGKGGSLSYNKGFTGKGAQSAPVYSKGLVTYYEPEDEVRKG